MFPVHIVEEHVFFDLPRPPYAACYVKNMKMYVKNINYRLIETWYIMNMPEYFFLIDLQKIKYFENSMKLFK